MGLRATMHRPAVLPLNIHAGTRRRTTATTGTQTQSAAPRTWCTASTWTSSCATSCAPVQLPPPSSHVRAVCGCCNCTPSGSRHQAGQALRVWLSAYCGSRAAWVAHGPVEQLLQALQMCLADHEPCALCLPTRRSRACSAAVAWWMTASGDETLTGSTLSTAAWRLAYASVCLQPHRCCHMHPILIRRSPTCYVMLAL